MRTEYNVRLVTGDYNLDTEVEDFAKQNGLPDLMADEFRAMAEQEEESGTFGRNKKLMIEAKEKSLMIALKRFM